MANLLMRGIVQNSPESRRFQIIHNIHAFKIVIDQNGSFLNVAIILILFTVCLGFAALYPQEVWAANGKGISPGCGTPSGYDCATPGFERPLTLEEAVALSKAETVVYLYGPGIQDAVLVAEVMSEGKNAPAIPAIAVPGRDVPKDALYVVILGYPVKHQKSGEPIAFYQRYLNRGEIFSLTRAMHKAVLEKYYTDG